MTQITGWKLREIGSLNSPNGDYVRINTQGRSVRYILLRVKKAKNDRPTIDRRFRRIGRFGMETSTFNQRGGFGKANQLFGEDLSKLLEGLKYVLAA